MTEEDDVTARTRDIIRLLAPADGASCERGDRLVEDLAFHSLALVELAFRLEEEFDLEPITYEEAQGIVTVGDVEDFVSEAARLTETP
jgi:acyl carrier protein